MASAVLNDNQIPIKSSDVSGLSIRGGRTCINLSQLNTKTIQVTTVSLYLSLSLSLSLFPLSGRSSHIIQLPLDHLHPTLVDHLHPHLSTCPIRHLLQLSVSRGSQGNTVQRSSPHKCSQKSSCSAFNAVVAAFPQIFLGFLSSRLFMRHVLIIGTSQKVIPVAKIGI